MSHLVFKPLKPMRKSNDYTSYGNHQALEIAVNSKAIAFVIPWYNEARQTIYAASNCGASWFEKAAAKAASYQKIFSFSKQQMISQLIYDGFTQEQAEYGASRVGL